MGRRTYGPTQDVGGLRVTSYREPDAKSVTKAGTAALNNMLWLLPSAL